MVAVVVVAVVGVLPGMVVDAVVKTYQQGREEGEIYATGIKLVVGLEGKRTRLAARTQVLLVGEDTEGQTETFVFYF